MHAAGTYFDGVVARGQPALIEWDGSGLVIRSAERSRELARWTAAEVRPADAGLAHRELRLKRLPPHQDRFVVGNADDARWLVERCPALRPGLRLRAGLRIAGWSAFAVAALVAFLELGLPVLADPAARALPAGIETELGRAARVQAIQALAPAAQASGKAECADAAGRRALDTLVGALAQRAMPPLDVRATVVDSEVINAFALPDRQILLTRGLLQFAEHPDEIAGVIAHELGHVAHRHPTAVALRQAGSAILLGTLIGDAGGGSMLGNVAVHAVNARYSREAERDADAFAAELIRRAGYDRERLARFLDRLERKHPGVDGPIAFLSTHPRTAERRAAIAAPDGNGGEGAPAAGAPALDPAQWAALRGICH